MSLVTVEDMTPAELNREIVSKVHEIQDLEATTAYGSEEGARYRALDRAWARLELLRAQETRNRRIAT